MTDSAAVFDPVWVQADRTGGGNQAQTLVVNKNQTLTAGNLALVINSSSGDASDTIWTPDP